MKGGKAAGNDVPKQQQGKKGKEGKKSDSKASKSADQQGERRSKRPPAPKKDDEFQFGLPGPKRRRQLVSVRDARVLHVGVHPCAPSTDCNNLPDAWPEEASTAVRDGGAHALSS